MNEQDILKGLLSDNPKTRIQTVSYLKESNLETAAPFLIQTLGDENAEYRQAAISTLFEIGQPAIPYIIEALKSSNPQIRSGAIGILIEIGDASISAALLNLLASKDGLARAAAIEVLGGIKDIWSLEYIRQFVNDSESTVRENAIRALGNFQDKISVDSLLPLLSDKEPAVRIAVCEALAKINESRVCDSLWEVSLADSDLKVRDTATSALKKIGESIIQPYEKDFLSLDVESRSRAMHDLTNFGKFVILPLLDLTTHHNPSVKELAIEILGNIGDSVATKRLIELTDDYEQSVRISAIIALGKMKSETALRFLIACLQSPDHTIETVASRILAEAGKDVIKFLPALISAQDLNAQILISRIIGKIGDSKVVPLLAQHLNDSRMWVRRAVCFALGETKNPIAGNLLVERCLFDTDTLVRTAAAQAIGKLKMSVLVEPLLSALQDDEESVRISVINALAEIGDSNVASHLIRFLSSDSIMLKIAAIQALLQLNYIGALPALKKLAKPWPFGHESEEVRTEANNALKKLSREAQFERP